MTDGSLRACDATRVTAEEVMISAATTRPPKFGEETGCCEPRGVCPLLLVRATAHPSGRAAARDPAVTKVGPGRYTVSDQRRE